MVTGRARVLQETNPRRVVVLDRYGRQRWSEVWQDNPRISPMGAAGQPLQDCAGHRPYIERTEPNRFWWRPYQPPKGEFYFTAQEKAFGAQYAGFVIVEPNLKARASLNKDWGFQRWQKLVRALPYRLAQLGPPGARYLNGVTQIPTPTFRHAAAVLAASRAYVGHEGALHHAAAALDRPAVVVRGGYVGHTVTGYDGQISLGENDLGCGWRTLCEHCRKAMARIGVDEVRAAVESVL